MDIKQLTDKQSDSLKPINPLVNIGGVEFAVRTMNQELGRSVTPLNSNGRLIRQIIPPPIPLKQSSPPKSLPPVAPLPTEKPISPKIDEAKELLKTGWTLYNSKNYLDALEKFENAANVAIGWWKHYQAQKAINICRRQLAAIEKEKEKKQKSLEDKFKAETQKKLKEERLAQLQAEKEQQIKQKAEEAVLRIKREAELKAEQEAVLAMERRRQAELKSKQEAALAAEIKKREEAKKEAIERERQEKEKQEREKMAREVAERQAQAVVMAKTHEEAARKIEMERKRQAAEQQAKAEAEQKVRGAEQATKLKLQYEEKKQEKIVIPPQKLNLTLIFTAILILIISGSVLYFLNSRKTTPPIVPVSQVQPPTPIFSVNTKKTITFQETIDKAQLINNLQSLLQEDQVAVTFKQIIFKKINAGKSSYLSANDLIDLINFSGISVKNYMFFSYSQLDLPTDPFLAGLEANRLGLIVEFSNNQTAKNMMDNWGNKLLNNITPLLLPQRTASATAFDIKSFTKTTYRGTDIYYLNLPNKYFSLDYAIIDKELIIATSKESMEATIDKIIK